MNKANQNFKLLDHTADIGILVQGSHLKDLFKNAAEALLQIMLKGPSQKPSLIQDLSVTGSDLADLMVRWLSEILYLFQGQGRIVDAIHIQDISPLHLTAQIQTQAFDPGLHEILYEIKAITYHQIEVVSEGDQWRARIIIDV
jgi:SHS2 domain-containing protein